MYSHTTSPGLSLHNSDLTSVSTSLLSALGSCSIGVGYGRHTEPGSEVASFNFPSLVSVLHDIATAPNDTSRALPRPRDTVKVHALQAATSALRLRLRPARSHRKGTPHTYTHTHSLSCWQTTQTAFPPLLSCCPGTDYTKEGFKNGIASCPALPCSALRCSAPTLGPAPPSLRLQSSTGLMPRAY